jgi:hypothetical protein
LSRYVAFADPSYSLPLALWTIGTFLYPDFDTFPYVVITSDTKRSGKTRLAELMSFMCSNPKQFGAMTGPGLYHTIELDKPTIFFDEAEVLSSESATNMRAVLNMGYRKGQSVPRLVHGVMKEFQTYCPKVFILIGDVYDTLKDRSIVVRMKRAEPRERFVYEPVKAEGAAIREAVDVLLKAGTGARIMEAFMSHKGISFLTDRDEELWTPLFVIASIVCPERMEELSRHAVDISTEKTQESRRYVNLQGEEKKAEDDEYARRLLVDVAAALHGHRSLSSKVIVDTLRALPTSPWRKFRGEGLTMRNLADMLSRFGVKPVVIRVGKGKHGDNSNVTRGYNARDIERATKKTH